MLIVDAHEAFAPRALHNAFLVGGYVRGSGAPVHLHAIVQHIARVCQLIGSARHSAIGSDFDGGAAASMDSICAMVNDPMDVLGISNHPSAEVMPDYPRVAA